MRTSLWASLWCIQVVLALLLVGAAPVAAANTEEEVQAVQLFDQAMGLILNDVLTGVAPQASTSTPHSPTASEAASKPATSPTSPTAARDALARIGTSGPADPGKAVRYEGAVLGFEPPARAGAETVLLDVLLTEKELAAPWRSPVMESLQGLLERGKPFPHGSLVGALLEQAKQPRVLLGFDEADRVLARAGLSKDDSTKRDAAELAESHEKLWEELRPKAYGIQGYLLSWVEPKVGEEYGRWKSEGGVELRLERNGRKPDKATTGTDGFFSFDVDDTDPPRGSASDDSPSRIRLVGTTEGGQRGNDDEETPLSPLLWKGTLGSSRLNVILGLPPALRDTLPRVRDRVLEEQTSTFQAITTALAGRMGLGAFDLVAQAIGGLNLLAGPVWTPGRGCVPYAGVEYPVRAPSYDRKLRPEDSAAVLRLQVLQRPMPVDPHRENLDSLLLSLAKQYRSTAQTESDATGKRLETTQELRRALVAVMRKQDHWEKVTDKAGFAQSVQAVGQQETALTREREIRGKVLEAQELWVKAYEGEEGAREEAAENARQLAKQVAELVALYGFTDSSLVVRRPSPQSLPSRPSPQMVAGFRSVRISLIGDVVKARTEIASRKRLFPAGITAGAVLGEDDAAQAALGAYYRVRGTYIPGLRLIGGWTLGGGDVKGELMGGVALQIPLTNVEK